MSKPAQLVGHPPFGRLTVISREGSDKHKKATWRCRCECGGEIVCNTGALMSGNTQSCGCLNRNVSGARFRTHGGSKSPEYNNWMAMKARCYNSENQDYALYGGRGITVCDRWRNSFENFLSDMGPRPFSRATVERKNTNGNYEPGNCVWASQKSQTRNMRTNHLLTIDGVTKTIVEWSEVSGTSARKIRQRVAMHGWSPKDAVFSPNKTRWSRRKLPA